MIELLVVGIVLWIGVGCLAVSLCSMAARADHQQMNPSPPTAPAADPVRAARPSRRRMIERSMDQHPAS